MRESGSRIVETSDAGLRALRKNGVASGCDAPRRPQGRCSTGTQGDAMTDAISLSTLPRLGALALAAALAACSGGSELPNGGISGGEGTGTGSGGSFGGTTAEGVYGGSLSGGSFGAFVMAVLENGSFWQFYGRGSTAALDVAGFVQGTGSSSAGAFQSADALDFGLVPAAAATVTATYTSTPSITGSVAEGVQSITFTGAGVADSAYDYKVAAALSTLEGTWNLNSMSGVATSLVFDAAGAFTGTDTVGCTLSGNATTRASGKNVFDVRLVIGPAPCPAAGTTLSGIALALPAVGGSTSLLIGAVDSSRTIGFGASGVR
jgi:hypothetical protein